MSTKPWTFRGNIITNSEGCVVAEAWRDRDDINASETAARIVGACNQHEDLLAALRATLPALERLGDFIGNVHDGSGASRSPPFDRCAIILQVKDAIRNATGEPT